MWRFLERIRRLKSNHDRQLAQDAIEMPNIWWGAIDPEEAETEEGRKLLKDIQTFKWHMEEFADGTL